MNKPVEVTWQDKAGMRRQNRGRCLDASAGGLKLELPDAIATDTRIDYRVLDTNLLGKGVVRYCEAAGLNYEIGMEFRKTAADS